MEYMNKLSKNKCGYTWPEDYEIGHRPRHQSCCWRDTIEGSEYCVWHADPANISKSVKQLQKARIPPEVREQFSQDIELLDGAQLSDIKLGDEISFGGVSLRNSDLSGAYLKGSDLSNVNLMRANLSNANLDNVDLSNAYLYQATFSSASLHKADLTDAHLNDTDFSNAYLPEVDFSGTDSSNADFSGAELADADFSDASLTGADFSDSNLMNADLPDADLRGANLCDATFWGVDFSHSDLRDANLSDANLRDADLIDTDLEHTVFIRTNLFGADLTNAKPHGATFTDVQINDDTIFRSVEDRKEGRQWWQKGPFFPPLRCGYDPSISDEADNTDTDQLGKAADTYQTFEKLSRENARPSLQSEMFVLRQDMQRKRHWHNNKYIDWGFARVSRTIFKHGESLARIFSSAVLIVAVYGLFYANFDLIIDADGDFVSDPVDALYFSTLTFTTLGLGDFQPLPASETARMLVTSQAALGAILIAIFVFVLGRRAAR